ncbi:hypothetical protein ABI59_23015 [Acidobacteria bacterium Mor1]|nr:hypothetical protein ABI59_23015 [Acidobacteria bacterium Mor1]
MSREQKNPSGREPLSRRARLALLILLAVFCVGCDQAAKSVARDALASQPPMPLAGGTVVLEYAENPGGMLGLGGGLAPRARFALLVVAVAAALGAVVAFVASSPELSAGGVASLGLFLGGGVGNLMDRIDHGYVIDFVHMGFGSLRTGIFNVADVAILAGAAGFVFFKLRGRRP